MHRYLIALLGAVALILGVAWLGSVAPAGAALADTNPCSTGSWSWDSTNTQGINWWTVPNLVNQESTYDNEWSGDGAPAEMCANGPGQVAVYSGQPNGNTAVETFPATQYNPGANRQPCPECGPQPSTLKEVRTYFSGAYEPQSNGTNSIGIGPNGVDNELASDDFLWNSAKPNASAYEVMDWVADNGQSPGGTLQTKYGIINIDGGSYELWCGYSGDAGQGLPCNPPTMDSHFYGYFVFFQVNPATCTTPSYSCQSIDSASGYVPHLALIRWLMRHGLMLKTGTYLAQEQFGWEICGDPSGGGAYGYDQHLIVKNADGSDG